MKNVLEQDSGSYHKGIGVDLKMETFFFNLIHDQTTFLWTLVVVGFIVFAIWLWKVIV